MRRIVLLASPVAIALALFACEDSGSGGATGGFTTEAGTFEAGPPSEAGPIGDGAVDAPVAKSVTVSVVRGLGPAVGATVVFHDAAGVVLESKATGADGRATSSDGVAPAQASVLLGVGSNRHIITWTAVELGDVLLARDDDNGSDLGGSLNVATQGTFADGGAVTMTASVGDCTGYSQTSPIQIFMGSSCTRSTAAVLARALGPGEGSNPLLAYAFAKGKPPAPTDGGVGSIAVGPWISATTAKVTPKNVPVDGSASAVLYEIADGLGILNETGSVSRVDPATTYLVAPGFADAYQAGARMSSSSTQGATIAIARRGAPAATNDIDFTGAPPALDSATLDSTTVAQPSVAWTTVGGASLAAMDGGAVVVSWFDTRENSGTWTFVVPPGAKSVKAPAMPKAAEPWLPHGENDAGGAVSFQEPIVLFAEADILPGYADFRKGAGLVIPLTTPYEPDARAILPANGTLKVTSFRQILR
jgi:hypothetical protein